MSNINANAVLDLAIERNRLKNDAALARLLEIAPPVVSKLRHDRLPVGPSIILSLVELAGLTLEEVRTYFPRKKLGHE